MLQNLRVAFFWERYDRKRRNRPSAHGIHITERVGRGNLTEQVRIVDNRREEIHGLHQRQRFGDAVDPGVIIGIEANDYVALLAYVQRDNDHIDLLQDMRLKVGERRRVATCAEFGPRFLHSTGQAYKGGPDSGVFLQITADDASDLPVPGQKASFGVIKAAQARGDFDVLTERGRRALRVHLKGDLASGLKMLDAAIADALG